MKLRNILKAVGGIALFTFLLALVVTSPSMLRGGPVLAAPELQEQDLPQAILVNASAITTDTNFTPRRWLSLTTKRPTTADIYWDVDIGTLRQAALYLQVAPHPLATFTPHNNAGTLVTVYATDTTGYTTTAVHMPYFRVRAELTSSDTITPEIWVILR